MNRKEFVNEYGETKAKKWELKALKMGITIKDYHKFRSIILERELIYWAIYAMFIICAVLYFTKAAQYSNLLQYCARVVW
jgi:hypothetical protein